MTRRGFLRLCGATVVAAATGIFPGRTVSATEAKTPINQTQRNRSISPKIRKNNYRSQTFHC